MQNLSYENEFSLHVNRNLFSYERLCTMTCFEKEVRGNSEMAYYLKIRTQTQAISSRVPLRRFLLVKNLLKEVDRIYTPITCVQF